MARPIGEPFPELLDSGGGTVSVAGATAAFLDHCRVSKGLSTHTLRAYGSDLSNFAKSVGHHTCIGRVGRQAILSYARKLLDVQRLGEASVKRHMATLKVFFRWLAREGAVPDATVHRLDFAIRLPRRLPRTLDRSEMQALVRAAEHSISSASSAFHFEALLMHFIVIVLFITGLRISELVSIELGDIAPTEGALRARGKGSRERWVYLPTGTPRRTLDVYLGTRQHVAGSSGRLLVSSSGRPVSAQGVRRRLRALGEHARLTRRVTPHMLRHTAATHLLEAGVDIRFVQRLLGHSSIVTTQIYAEVRDTSLRAVLSQADTLTRLVSV